MRKRLLVMLICTALTAAVLSGCGSKEVNADPAESTPIKENVVEESSEPAPVEETTTPEPTEPVEEPIPEPTTEVNEKLDIVVEVSPELQQAKDEKMPIGVETTLGFGTIIRLGNNEDYPNALENLEIHYMDKVFQVALPKDMCMKFWHDNETYQLDIYNEDESKLAWFFFTEMTLTEEDKFAMSNEDFKNYITKRGISALDDAEVKTLVETKDILVQSIPGEAVSRTGEFVIYNTYDNEPFEKEKEDGQIEIRDSGWEYSFFYGDKGQSPNPELASYIAESFKVAE